MATKILFLTLALLVVVNCSPQRKSNWRSPSGNPQFGGSHGGNSPSFGNGGSHGGNGPSFGGPSFGSGSNWGGSHGGNGGGFNSGSHGGNGGNRG